jgi:carboxypeptidase family protein/TonB-dependent receptor-like protein
MNSVIAICKKVWDGRRKNAVQLLGGLFAVLLLCLPAFSQGSFGRILGTVSDQSGGVIAGATVTVLDVDRGVTRTLTTDDAGAYNAPNLTPGNYTVRVEAKGFQRLQRSGIGIEVGHEVRIDLTVQPGEQSQTVTVTESVPLVETTNATMGGTLENSDIVDLPLNGRDYQNLLGLRPGVMLMVGGGPWTQSTNNVRPDESVWMIEGVFNANPFDARPVVGMPSPFTDGATILPVDAIQEFNVMENPKAEYGWKAGAVVNVGIKSGTNQFHGSAYAFGRYDAWDARNFYNVANPISGCPVVISGSCLKYPAQLKQFGGVAGGPIKKDKLFFFGGYEGLRSYIAPAAGISSPQLDTAGGKNCLTSNGCDSIVDAINLVGLANASKVSESILCPNAIGQSGASLPAGFVCTGGLWQTAVSGTTGTISAFPISNTSDNGIGKLDWHPNDKNAINGVFFLGNYTATGEDHAFVGIPFNNTVPIKAWTATTSWVYTPNSNTVNELRFGLTRTTFNFVNIDVNVPADGKGYKLNTGVTDSLTGGLPNINIGGFSTGLGTASNRPQYYSPNPFYDVQDSVSLLKGKHSFKFGGEIAFMEADANVYNVGRGLFNFPTLQAFFQGAPGSGQVLAGKPAIKNNSRLYSGYVQDDWRVTPKLIINLGLRYEYVTPMKEASNLWGSFDPASTSGMVQQGQAGHATLWKADPSDLSPRIGFAWDVTGRGTTVVRGGASIIYSSFVQQDFQGAFGLQNNHATALGSNPTGALISCLGPAALGESVCPATGGGTIGVGVVNFVPSQLCWDASSAATCTATAGVSQGTVFPSVAAKCGDGVGGAPQPCDLMAVDPNLKLPYILNYNVSLQHQFGSNLSLQVAYVGNHGYRLLNFADINQAPLGAAYCMNTPRTSAQAAGACAGVPLTGSGVGTANGTALQEARPYFTKFPYVGFINDVTNRAHSRYDSLQVTLTERASHGLSFTAGYTYAHGLDNGSLNRFGGLPQDSNNLASEYASSDLDARHRLSLTATYDIPGIKGFGQLLEGWELNAIVSYQSPLPWMAADGIYPGPPGNNFGGTAENSDRWNISGPASSFPSGLSSIPYCFGGNCTVVGAYGPTTTVETPAQTAGCNAGAAASGAAASGTYTFGGGGCYASLDGKAFLTPNALGQYGNMGRNIFRDSGFKNLDMSIFKNFKFRERYGIQARWEVFNVFNHPLAANPYGAGGFVNANNLLNAQPFGSALATPDFIAGNPLIGSGSQRVMQVGLKLTF